MNNGPLFGLDKADIRMHQLDYSSLSSIKAADQYICRYSGGSHTFRVNLTAGIPWVKPL